MKETSVLSCESIRIVRAPGRTDALIAALQDYLRALVVPSEAQGVAQVELVMGDERVNAEWSNGDDCPLTEAAICRIAEESEIELRINLCCDQFRLYSYQDRLFRLLNGGALKDCVRYRTLIQDERSASLSMSGFYRGAFLHGDVPFTRNNEDILARTGWNGTAHRASFRFDPAYADDVLDIADLLEAHFEIELTCAPDGASLNIDCLRLGNADDVRYYREVLQKLASIAAESSVTGALASESEDTFALLRFVLRNGVIIIETACTE